MSKRQCSICSSPNVAAIDDLLDAGTNQKDVAEQFSVSRYAISRHVRHSAPVPANGNGDAQEEVSKWLQRADDQYLLATANADQRGAIQALVAGLRAVESQVRSKERESEATEAGDEFQTVTLETLDRLTASALDTPRGKMLAALISAPDRVLELAVRLENDPDLGKKYAN